MAAHPSQKNASDLQQSALGESRSRATLFIELKTIHSSEELVEPFLPIRIAAEICLDTTFRELEILLQVRR